MSHLTVSVLIQPTPQNTSNKFCIASTTHSPFPGLFLHLFGPPRPSLSSSLLPLPIPTREILAPQIKASSCPLRRSARVFSGLAHGGGRRCAPPRDVLVPSPSRRRPQARPLVAGAPAAAARAPAAGAAQKEVSQGGRRVRPAPPRRGQRRLRA
jgi:hypothetical protein